MATSARENFRWAFQEQMRTRTSGEFDSDEYREDRVLESAAMDAFDYVWREYGLDSLNIGKIREQ